jgi:hypothetical protein
MRISVNSAPQFDVYHFVSVNAMMRRDVIACRLNFIDIRYTSVRSRASSRVNVVIQIRGNCRYDAISDCFSLTNCIFVIVFVIIRNDHNELIAHRKMSKFGKCTPSPQRIES